MADRPDYQGIKENTAAELRRGGMDGRKADEAARRITQHVEKKANGQPVPERFAPIRDLNRGR